MAKYLIAEEGLLKGLILIIENKDEYKIGRDPDLVDFVLDDSSVSRKHALIYKEEDNLCITDLSHTNPTSVNGLPISDFQILNEGDIVQIGKTSFRYTEKKPDEEELEKLSPKIDEDLEAFTSPNGEVETIVENGEEKEESEVDEIKESVSPEEENVEILKKPQEKEESPYDTIFEEETEEELPFNVVSENALILKVLSGSNAGAEFAMDKGESYIIGKDPKTCSIVFNDLSVSKEHAKISVDQDGKCLIEDLGSRNGVIVNSKKIDKKEELTTKDLILLGSTTFVIIDPKEAQETLYALAPPSYEEILKEEELTEEKKEALGEETKVIDWRKIVIPPKHLIISGSIIIVLFIMFISFFSLFKSSKVEIAKKEPIEEIQKALDKFKGVQFSFNPANGKLFLVGHVLSAVDQQELMYNIDAIEFVESTENNIIIDEYVWKSINDLLNDNAPYRSVNVHSSQPGQFIASGYVQGANDLERLSDYLKANFPFYDKLQNKVVIEDVLKTEIEGMIISRGLGAISYQLASGEVILAGRYSMDDATSFEKFLDQLKKIDGVRSIKNAAIKTTPDMARINLSQRYKITGIVTNEGKKVVSVIANDKLINIDGFLDGMKVTEITANTIYLEKDGLKYKIDYIR